WFYGLLILLFLLGLNTLICLGKRLLSLLPQSSKLGWRVFSVRLCPSLIHLSFLVVLFGHFLSMTAGFVSVVDARPGATMAINGERQLTITDTTCAINRETADPRERIKQCLASLSIRSPNETSHQQVRLNEPLYWSGLRMHLVMDKTAQGEPLPALRLIVRNDPGWPLVVAGFFGLILFLFWYYFHEKILGG
ncbi:MAG: hypothetical protein PHY31_10325, partial [Smithellaceae bacterium]|nr:hypothetical protein [Smithellaceae bacterium]